MTHRFANGVEKGVTGVFHQMPTVGDLIDVWQGSCNGLRISTATVSCDDLDLGLLDQPGLGGCLFPVGQQCDCPSVRIPMKPAIGSETKPATCSDFIPASIPI